MVTRKKIITSDYIGQRYGRLIIVGDGELRFSGKKRTFLCKCDCGNMFADTPTHILQGHSNSCGCFRREVKTTHGMSGRNKLYNAWQDMKRRCNDVNWKGYKDWGGRGITYDTIRENFENFRDDMQDSFIEHINTYGRKQTTLDRIDNNLNYGKDNCRRATYKIQLNNTRKNLLIT